MGFVAAAGVGMQVVGAYNQSKASKSAYKYQSQVAANNAQIAEWQSQDALLRGQQAEANQRLKTGQLKSTQRARMAANGIALDEGSPLNILTTTDYMGEQDAATIRNNAEREAWGYRVQKGNYADQSHVYGARSDAENPFMAGASTLLTSGSQVADRWYTPNSVGSDSSYLKRNPNASAGEPRYDYGAVS